MCHLLENYTFDLQMTTMALSKRVLPMHVVGGVGWAIGLLREDTPKL